MIGGYNNGRMSSVEIFPPSPSDTCSIPDLPEMKSGHSASVLPGGRLVVCGGTKNSSTHLDSCVSWTPGEKSWTSFYKMRYCAHTCLFYWLYIFLFFSARQELIMRPGCRHPIQAGLCCWVAMTLPHALMLKYSQVVSKEKQSFVNKETIPCYDAGKVPFNLSHGGEDSCAIPDGDSVILTGGRSSDDYHEYVTR